MDISFLPDFGNVVISIFAFVALLSVIVAIHEYGHYIVGRWCGIHAEVFSLGFGPVLWSRMDRRGTKWQIAALPFGGFVKFLGDANAASGYADEQAMGGLSAEERRHTMHGAPLWARAATVFAGPLANFILAFLVFFGMLLSQGVVTEPLTIAQIYDLPQEHELEENDQILKVEGIDIFDPELSEKLDELTDRSSYTYTVERGGQAMELSGPILVPARVTYTEPTLAAREAGVLEGDVIIAIEGMPVNRFADLLDTIAERDGAPVTLEIWRAGEVIELTVSPTRRDLPLANGDFETRWLIGVRGSYFFEPQVESPGLIAAAMFSMEEIVWRLTTTVSGIYHMIVGEISTCNMSGPIGIAEISGTAAKEGAVSFVLLIASISLAIGFVNLLPIPILDGGHLMFFAVEAVTRRKLNERVAGNIMFLGMVLILTLMLFATSQDLFCP